MRQRRQTGAETINILGDKSTNLTFFSIKMGIQIPFLILNTHHEKRICKFIEQKQKNSPDRIFGK